MPPGRAGRRARAGWHPTAVGLAAAPHGPDPRSATPRRRDAVGRDGGAPGGVDLAGVDEPLGGGDDRRQVDADLRPAVVVLGADVERGAGEGEVPRAGDEGESEQLRELGADLPGVGVDGVAAGEHEIEATEMLEGRGERARRGEGVGTGERQVGDEHAPAVDARSVPHATASRRVSSADDGPSVTTVTVPPWSAAMATACATARRQ